MYQQWTHKGLLLITLGGMKVDIGFIKASKKKMKTREGLIKPVVKNMKMEENFSLNEHLKGWIWSLSYNHNSKV